MEPPTTEDLAPSQMRSRSCSFQQTPCQYATMSVTETHDNEMLDLTPHAAPTID
jgi:hypothetical protein